MPLFPPVNTATFPFRPFHGFLPVMANFKFSRGGEQEDAFTACPNKTYWQEVGRTQLCDMHAIVAATTCLSRVSMPKSQTNQPTGPRRAKALVLQRFFGLGLAVSVASVPPPKTSAAFAAASPPSCNSRIMQLPLIDQRKWRRHLRPAKVRSLQDPSLGVDFRPKRLVKQEKTVHHPSQLHGPYEMHPPFYSIARRIPELEVYGEDAIPVISTTRLRPDPCDCQRRPVMDRYGKSHF